LRPGRRRFLCQLPLWFYIYIYVCVYSFLLVLVTMDQLIPSAISQARKCKLSSVLLLIVVN
jgi:hypothetical protein